MAHGRNESGGGGGRGRAERGRARQLRTLRRPEACAPSGSCHRRGRTWPWATVRFWRRRRRRQAPPVLRRAPDRESPFSAVARPAYGRRQRLPRRPRRRGPSARGLNGELPPRGPHHGPADPACRRQSRSRKSQAWPPGEMTASRELYRNPVCGPARVTGKPWRLDWARETPIAGRMLPPGWSAPRRGYAAGRRMSTSAIAAEAKTRLTMPLMVKNARLTRDRSLARTSDCS